MGLLLPPPNTVEDNTCAPKGNTRSSGSTRSPSTDLTHLSLSLPLVFPTLHLLVQLSFEPSAVRYGGVIKVKDVHEVGDVTGCQTKRLYLGQLRVTRYVRDTVPQAREGAVDAVSPTTFLSVGGHSSLDHSDLHAARDSAVHRQHRAVFRRDDAVRVGRGRHRHRVGRVRCHHPALEVCVITVHEGGMFRVRARRGRLRVSGVRVKVVGYRCGVVRLRRVASDETHDGGDLTPISSGRLRRRYCGGLVSVGGRSPDGVPTEFRL